MKSKERIKQHNQKVAKEPAINNQQVEELNPKDEEGCIEYVLDVLYISFMHSDTLLGLENEGVVQLLVLNDLICKVMNADTPVNFPVGALSDGNTHDTPIHIPSTTIPNITTSFSPQQHSCANTLTPTPIQQNSQ